MVKAKKFLANIIVYLFQGFSINFAITFDVSSNALFVRKSVGFTDGGIFFHPGAKWGIG